MLALLHSDLLKYIGTFLDPVYVSILRYVCPRFRQVFPPTKSRIIPEIVPHYRLFDWMWLKKCRFNNNVLDAIGKENHRYLIATYFLDAQFDKISQIAGALAESGHLDTLQWLHQENQQFVPNDMVLPAVRGGHVNVLDYALQNGPACSGYDNFAIVNYAIHCDRLSIVEYIHRRVYWIVRSTSIVYTAAICGRLEILQWLVSHNFAYNKEDCILMARVNHPKNTELIRWINENM